MNAGWRMTLAFYLKTNKLITHNVEGKVEKPLFLLFKFESVYCVLENELHYMYTKYRSMYRTLIQKSQKLLHRNGDYFLLDICNRNGYL